MREEMNATSWTSPEAFLNEITHRATDGAIAAVEVVTSPEAQRCETARRPHRKPVQ